MRKCFAVLKVFSTFAKINVILKYKKNLMSYTQMAQLELMNALNNITSEADLKEFRNLVANYFAQKAQKAIDALWDNGSINEDTIEQWGAEHMRTPYRYASHRS